MVASKRSRKRQQLN